MGGGSKNELSRYVNPIAAFHPSVGMINMGQSKDGDRGQCGIPSKKYSSITDEKLLLNSELGVDSKEIESDKMEMMLNPSKSQIEVHGAEGSYLMERSKWPTLMLPSENLT